MVWQTTIHADDVACEDINECKQAEAKLQEEELLPAFFENSPNLIFVKDRQSRSIPAAFSFGAPSTQRPILASFI